LLPFPFVYSFSFHCLCLFLFYNFLLFHSYHFLLTVLSVLHYHVSKSPLWKPVVKYFSLVPNTGILPKVYYNRHLYTSRFAKWYPSMWNKTKQVKIKSVPRVPES
jgi:hypothetical protein